MKEERPADGRPSGPMALRLLLPRTESQWRKLKRPEHRSCCWTENSQSLRRQQRTRVVKKNWRSHNNDVQKGETFAPATAMQRHACSIDQSIDRLSQPLTWCHVRLASSRLQPYRTAKIVARISPICSQRESCMISLPCVAAPVPWMLGTGGATPMLKAFPMCEHCMTLLVGCT